MQQQQQQQLLHLEDQQQQQQQQPVTPHRSSRKSAKEAQENWNMNVEDRARKERTEMVAAATRKAHIAEEAQAASGRKEWADPPVFSAGQEKEFYDHFVWRMGTTPEECMAVIEEMTPPYSLNVGMDLLHEKRRKKEQELQFGPYADDVANSDFEQNSFHKPGEVIRKPFGGYLHYGKIVSNRQTLENPETGKMEEYWEVEYADGGK